MGVVGGSRAGKCPSAVATRSQSRADALLSVAGPGSVVGCAGLRPALDGRTMPKPPLRTICARLSRLDPVSTRSAIVCLVLELYAGPGGIRSANSVCPADEAFRARSVCGLPQQDEPEGPSSTRTSIIRFGGRGSRRRRYREANRGGLRLNEPGPTVMTRRPREYVPA